jgi:hypothetical protein
MSVRDSVRVRLLPGELSVDGYQLSLRGRLLEVDLRGSERQYGIGDLVEIENGDTIYFGEILRRTESSTFVLIDHSLDRTKLPSIEETWA